MQAGPDSGPGRPAANNTRWGCRRSPPKPSAGGGARRLLAPRPTELPAELQQAKARRTPQQQARHRPPRLRRMAASLPASSSASELDEWVAQLMECKHLSEENVRKLTDRVSRALPPSWRRPAGTRGLACRRGLGVVALATGAGHGCPRVPRLQSSCGRAGPRARAPRAAQPGRPWQRKHREPLPQAAGARAPCPSCKRLPP